MAFRSTVVETFDHQKIADEPVDTEGFPYGEDFFRHEVPVVVSHVNGEFDERLRSPGRYHGRSYVINRSWAENGHKIPELWADRYGNIFTEVVTKGNNFSRSEIIPSGTAPSGYIPYGLQEGDALLRVLKASKLLREAKVDTEWIVRVQEPKKLAYRPEKGHGYIGELVTPVEYKALIIQKKLAEIAMADVSVEAVPDGEDIEEELTESEIRKISEAITAMDFFVTLRAVSTPYRVADFIKDNGTDELESINYDVLCSVFETYNKVSKARKSEFENFGLPSELTLEVGQQNRLENINLFFKEVLPKLIGINMARLHNLRLVHVFPHAGNVTALGGLVDLDSVRGEALELDDDASDVDDIYADLYQISNDSELRLLYTLLARLNKEVEEAIPEEKMDQIHSVVVRIMSDFNDPFLAAYFEERGLRTGDKEKKKEIIDLIASLCYDEFWPSAKSYLRDASEPYVGDYIREEAGVLCEELLAMSAADMASALYLGGIIESEEDFLIHNGVFDGSQIVPDHEQLKSGMREYFGGNRDGVELVSEDVFDNYLAQTIEAHRLEQFSARFDELSEGIKERLRDTALEDMDIGSLTWIIILHSVGTIRSNIYNFMMPNPDEVWGVMAHAFEVFSHKRATGVEISAAEVLSYFRSLDDPIIELQSR